MKGPPTQKGNPHELTRNQHVLPRASIARFAGADGRVDRMLKHRGLRHRIAPSDPIFCTNRCWDQRAEQGYMLAVEDAFQSLADLIVAGDVRTLDGQSQTTVTDFFTLVIAREAVRGLSREDISFADRSGNELSLDQQEQLERRGYLFLQPDGTIARRMAVGIEIQAQLMWSRRVRPDQRWGIWHSPGSELLVPDELQPLGAIPLNPQILLAAGMGNHVMTPSEVRDYNHRAVSAARAYYFARDLDATG